MRLKQWIHSILYSDDKKITRFYIFCAAIYFTQATGTTGGIAGTTISYFMKEGLALSATTLAYIGSLVSLAWWVKPGFGLLSDFVPIYGYRRKSYIYIANSFSILLWLALSGMAFSGVITTFWPIAIISFIMAFNFAMTDVVADGLMVQTGKATNSTGKFQAVQWGTIRLAIMLTTILGSIIALWAMPDTGEEFFQITSSTYNRLATIFLFASLFPIINMAATYYLTEEEKIELTKEKFDEIKAGVKKAITMEPVWILAICIFGLNFSPGWGTPFFYYLRDHCGPNYGQMGKMTFAYLGTFESGLGILGCIAYYKYCRKIEIKKILYLSIALSTAASICYLWIQGIVSLIIVAILFGPVFAFVNLAFLDLVAKNCPNLAEGFVFAGMCSIINIASSSSSAFGGWMYGLLEGERVIKIANESGEVIDKLIPAGQLYNWGWSWTSWMTDIGVSQYMVGLRPLILVSALFTVATVFLIPLLKLDKEGIMKFKN